MGNISKRVKITSKNADKFSGEAICFYKPFPLKKMGIGDLLRYIAETLTVSDFILFGVTTLVITLLGMLTPKLNHIIFSKIVKVEKFI